MRIAIYDEILETHVIDSLERALLRRGHEVYRTGKIGSGFEFPTKPSHIDHLTVAVRSMCDWQPDTVFVMRPASLPPHLLEFVRRTGARLVAWFSDDPVLFDLTYGPVVDMYDVILNCGNERVLRFYDERFGRAVGVNFPFWTDHVAFPTTWGTDRQLTDFVFIGNVHDDVRRKRYFDLGHMRSTITIHGSVGADHFGIWGGYLDSDEEVRSAVSVARFALNIPQFFRNHQGLRTWFDGLGDLGYFEYPSRVVQYMALGIPTVSVVPGAPSFPTYPEMIVVSSVQEADEVASAYPTRASLEDVSRSVTARFDSCFSADSRVRMLEYVLESDDWRTLTSTDRASLFTNFAPDSSDARETVASVIPGAADHGVRLEAPRCRAWILSDDWQAVSQAASLAACLEQEDRPVVCISLADHGPDGVARYSSAEELTEAAISASSSASDGDQLFVVQASMPLTRDLRERLEEAGIAIIWLDPSTGLKLSMSVARVDMATAYCTSDIERYRFLVGQGYSSVRYVPRLLHPSFIAEVDSTEPTSAMRRIEHSAAATANAAPAFEFDIRQDANVAVAEWKDIDAHTIESLVSCLRSQASFLAFGGTRQAPEVPSLAVYAAYAADVTLIPRCHEQWRLGLLRHGVIQVSEPGEIRAKTHLMTSSDRYGRFVRSRRASLIDAQTKIVADLSAIRAKMPRPAGILRPGDRISPRSITLRADPIANSVRIGVGINSCIGSDSEWSLELKLDDKTVLTDRIGATQEYFLPCSSSSTPSVAFVYHGRARYVPHDVAISSTVHMSKELVMSSNSKFGGRLI